MQDYILREDFPSTKTMIKPHEKSFDFHALLFFHLEFKYDVCRWSSTVTIKMKPHAKEGQWNVLESFTISLSNFNKWPWTSYFQTFCYIEKSNPLFGKATMVTFLL